LAIYVTQPIPLSAERTTNMKRIHGILLVVIPALLMVACTDRNPASIQDTGVATDGPVTFLDGAAVVDVAVPDLPPPDLLVIPDPGWHPDVPPPLDLQQPDKAQPLKDVGVPQPDQATPQLDITVPPDQATPVGDQTPTCNPPGYTTNLVTNSDKAGDWALMLEPATTYKAVTITGAAAKQAAATFDFNQAWQQVAGFVVSVPSTSTDVAAQATGAIKAVTTLLYGTSVTDSAGTKGKTHDGYQAMFTTVVSVKMASTSDVSLVRNTVISALLGVSASNLTGLPGIFGAGNQDFIIRMTTVLRSDGRVVVVGAVTDKAGDADLSKKTHIISTDIGGGTGLADHGSASVTACETKALTKPPTAKVDFIWVIDESGSMQGKRTNLANNAATFFSLAASNGLDFRMGVTNVCNPNGSYKTAVGKFCSSTTTVSTDLGGTDRFLGPTEQKIFAACVKNPPGYEQALEYGLVNAEAAVKNHLPRAGNKLDKIRTDAQLVIIVVTDEVPNSLTSTIGNGNMKTCTLPTTNQTNLDTKLKPTIDYFKGTKNKETKVDYFHGVAGICSNSCGIQVAHGYKEVAKALNGEIYDLCASDLTAKIKTIINKLKATASTVVLANTPVSASLRVALNGVSIKRGLLNGFNYMQSANSLVFYGTFSWPKGSTLTVTYSRWK
jgi:hypothetical protein